MLFIPDYDQTPAEALVTQLVMTQDLPYACLLNGRLEMLEVLIPEAHTKYIVSTNTTATSSTAATGAV